MRWDRGKSWTATIHVVGGFPVAVLTNSLVSSVGLVAGLVSLTGVGRDAGRRLLFEVIHWCTHIQRRRFDALLGMPLRPAPPNWRQFWYHFVVGLTISVLGFSALVSLWSAAFVAVLWPVLTPGGDVVMRVGLPLLGVVLAVVAVLVAPGIAALELRVAWRMLEPSEAEELAQRVETLTESRADVVDAADAERRRIERDLHDGAQQRLVSLAMNLGMARAKLSDVDGPARDAIVSAHEEAKQALAELRQLVRGLHPAVLDDRGLDAALSGIAARSPVPARLTVEVPQRPSPTVEAVAYFVVSEALSNVAKHAHASQVEIAVRRADEVLRVEIRDDGVGGADPAGGTGLRGLAQRVSSVDGTLQVSSPAGGPTVIVAELPCES
jgi:signal transduction histidine kinase